MPYYPRPLVPAVDRFEAKIVRVPIAGCWIWTGAGDPNGYGRFNPRGKPMLAHRFAYEHYIGPIPDGMLLCHRCDVAACCNPAHMFIGTQKENMADAVTKRRVSAGEHRPLSVLTRDAVAAIRASDESHSVLAAQYGVHRMTIGKIKRGERWK